MSSVFFLSTGAVLTGLVKVLAYRAGVAWNDVPNPTVVRSLYAIISIANGVSVVNMLFEIVFCFAPCDFDELVLNIVQVAAT